MHPLQIAIIAAEPSGDSLGAQLMAALQTQQPEHRFVGIGGPQMIAQGLQSLAPMETLSVMGLVEVLGRLPSILRLRRALVQRWLNTPPDLFIGVDAPDFNLPLAKRLRAAGIPTVHYVCPSVWAWRPGRITKIQAATDLLFSVFPFEQDFLRQNDVSSTYVGHTLATQIPLQPDKQAARKTLHIPATKPVLAILPGSRQGEVNQLAQPFLETAVACRQQIPDLHIIAPMANPAMAELWQAACARYAPDMPIQTELQTSQTVLTAADVALVASGTATLETMLCKRPMVVGYHIHPLSYHILKNFRLVNPDKLVLANILADEPLAPTFIQNDCTAERLAPALLHLLQSPHVREKINQAYTAVHQTMQVNTDQRIIAAITHLMS